MQLNYRPDIDGLRALAVVSVVLFHLDEQLVPGGFVGVDIFFVISGYLITKLIVKEVTDRQSFSYKTFYLRRARRLFPALAFTLAFSLIMSYSLFSPQHLASFGESVVYAILSLSNVLFWSQSNYFDQENFFKPLLHTWSLSIEEQFYFIWPALLCFLFLKAKAKAIPVILLIIGLLSLYLNHYFLANQDALGQVFLNDKQEQIFDIRSTVFYLLPFRVFEFVIGALLVWLPTLESRKRLNEILFLIGVVLITYALFIFDGKTTFPSLNALVPCIGAALLIYAGPNHALAALLKNRLMVVIGLISYSLYLIHWPLIVFYRYAKYQPLDKLDYLIIGFASGLIATLMYRYIEQPFRKPKQTVPSDFSAARPALGKPNRRFVLGALSMASILCLVGWNAHTSAGWLWRYPADVVKQFDFKEGDYTEFFWQKINSYDREFLDNGKAKVLIVGDSMAADLVNAISENGASDQLDIATFVVQHNCRGLLPFNEKLYKQLYAGGKDRCLAEHQRLQQDPRLATADVVILASYWWEKGYVAAIASTIKSLNDLVDAKVFLAGVKTQNSNGMWFLSKYAFQAHNHKVRTPLHPNAGELNRAMQNIEGDFTYFNLLDEFCDPSGCQRITKEGHLIIFDDSHLSPYGAKFVGAKLNDATWFQQLLRVSSE